jgi:hypothetical protein
MPPGIQSEAAKMTTRRINFLHRWIHANIDKAAPEVQASAREMVDRLLADADKAGISADEMEEEDRSVFEMVFAALEHRREEP